MVRRIMRGRASWPGLVAMALAAGCAPASDSGNGSESADSGLEGRVLIDGSSTVFPISQAVAEEFQNEHRRVQVVVGTSGTGGGFKKFAVGETDINDASRPIRESEIANCKENGITYIELTVAIDGLSIVVHPENDWCKELSIAQLKALWEPNSKISRWDQLNPAWPKEQITLLGPDTDSGTFDYFTEAVVGESKASRTDYTPSADDNVLVRGVSGDKFALGYFGYAYFEENADKLRVVAIRSEEGEKAVTPTSETIEAGEYLPLSRPLFLYVNTSALTKPHIAAFLKYYLDEGQELVSEVGYVKVSAEALNSAEKALEEAMSH